MSSTRYHTFLSYSREDNKTVEALALRLKEEGINPWLDKWNLIPGEPWQRAIEEALETCDTCTVCISPSGIGPWQNEEMRAAIDRRNNRGDFRVIPVLLPGAQREERSRLPAFLIQTTWVEFRESLEETDSFRRLVAGILGRAPGPDLEALPEAGICPYRGLQVFDIEHARFFFGRKALTEWLVDKLRAKPRQPQAHRFLAIVGASGSGKSSLARAGLIPALKHGALPDSQNWPVVIFKAGLDPIESLAVALKKNEVTGPHLKLNELNRDLRNEVNTLHLTVRLALEGQADSRRTIVLVDQFEEIFTLCKDEDIRRQFIGNLLHAATDAVGQTIVVLTLRADFYGKCAPYEQLAAALSDNQMLVSPMSDQELRDAIVKPAQLNGCEFETGLDQLLINDVKNQSGGLPLLEYALTQLWERRQGRILTHRAYRKLGGVTEALATRAEKVYADLSEASKKDAQHLMLRLVRVAQASDESADARKRATRSELGEKIWKVALRFAESQNRLLVVSVDPHSKEQIVEVAHEALIRHWQRLRGWIDSDRDFLLWKERLNFYLLTWVNSGRKDTATLLRGTQLIEALKWSRRKQEFLSEEEKVYIKKSKRARARSKLAKRAAAIVVIITFPIGSAWFFYTRSDPYQIHKIIYNMQYLRPDTKLHADQYLEALGFVGSKLLPQWHRGEPRNLVERLEQIGEFWGQLVYDEGPYFYSEYPDYLQGLVKAGKVERARKIATLSQNSPCAMAWFSKAFAKWNEKQYSVEFLDNSRNALEGVQYFPGRVQALICVADAYRAVRNQGMYLTHIMEALTQADKLEKGDKYRFLWEKIAIVQAMAEQIDQSMESALRGKIEYKSIQHEAVISLIEEGSIGVAWRLSRQHDNKLQFSSYFAKKFADSLLAARKFTWAEQFSSEIKDTYLRQEIQAMVLKALAEAGYVDKALQYSKQIDTDSYQIGAFMSLVGALTVANRFNEAMAIIEQNPRLIQSYPKDFAHLLTALVQANRIDDAKQFAKKISYASEMIAGALFQGGRPELARELVEKAIIAAKKPPIDEIISATYAAEADCRQAEALSGSLIKPENKKDMLKAIAMCYILIDEISEAERVSKLLHPHLTGQEIQQQFVEDFVWAAMRYGWEDSFPLVFSISSKLLDAGREAQADWFLSTIVQEATRSSGEEIRSKVVANIAAVYARLGKYREARINAEYCSRSDDKTFAYTAILTEYAKASNSILARNLGSTGKPFPIRKERDRRE